MATLISETAPASPLDGDLWVRTSDGYRQVWNDAAQTWMRFTVPAQSHEGTVLASRGATDRHLAKRSNTDWDAIWVDATQGILATHEQATESDQWQVSHNLRQWYVAVTVFEPGNQGTLGVEQTVIYPEIEYVDGFNCKLHFARPVKGTAFCRR